MGKGMSAKHREGKHTVSSVREPLVAWHTLLISQYSMLIPDPASESSLYQVPEISNQCIGSGISHHDTDFFFVIPGIMPNIVLLCFLYQALKMNNWQCHLPFPQCLAPSSPSQLLC